MDGWMSGVMGGEDAGPPSHELVYLQRHYAAESDVQTEFDWYEEAWCVSGNVSVWNVKETENSRR